MIDLKFIRENTEDVRRMLADRQTEAELNRLVELDTRWRENLTSYTIPQSTPESGITTNR